MSALALTQQLWHCLVCNRVGSGYYATILETVHMKRCSKELTVDAIGELIPAVNGEQFTVTAGVGSDYRREIVGS